MFDREGHLTEASAANVFLIRGDRLITPRLKPDVFPGITRTVVLEIARENGIDAAEIEARREDLTGIDGAFVCSTLMEMRPLSKLGEASLPTRDLPLYKALVASFRTLTHQ
jgi:branched-chain amino acid aminotransferase